MKRILESNNKIIHYILILISATIAAIPLINLRIYGTDDGFIHILRILGVENILKSGTFPPLINGAFCNGFGYAINVFYPPIVTFGPLIFRLFLSSYSNCLKIYSYITILVSGFTMYHFVKELSGKKEVALFSSVIYIFIPYRLETIYNRFAIGEFSAYMFIPLVFLGLHNLLYGDKKKHYYITIGAVGLMLTHTLTTEYTAMFAIIYILLNIPKLKDKEIVKKIVINVIFIITITSFFLIPLLEYKLHSEYRIFSPDVMYYRGEYVAGTAISLAQLFKDFEPNGVSFTLGITFTILMLLGVITYKKMNNQDKSNYLSFLVIAIISLYMTNRFFPWSIMPYFVATMQFAWRMLAFFEFAMSVLCGYNLFTFINMATKNKKKWFKELLSFSAVAIIIITMSKVNYNYKYEEHKKMTDDQYEKWAQSQEFLSIYSINREYLPCNEDMADYIIKRDNNAHVISGKAELKNQNKENLIFECTAINVVQDTQIELPFVNYPGYKITLEHNGEKEQIEYYQSDNGFISISIPKNMESVNISIKYVGTIIEKISYIITIISLILFIIYLIYMKRKDKFNETKT